MKSLRMGRNRLKLKLEKNKILNKKLMNDMTAIVNIITLRSVFLQDNANPYFTLKFCTLNTSNGEKIILELEENL